MIAQTTKRSRLTPWRIPLTKSSHLVSQLQQIERSGKDVMIRSWRDAFEHFEWSRCVLILTHHHPWRTLRMAQRILETDLNECPRWPPAAAYSGDAIEY